MDLSTVLSKIDLHQYQTAGDFLKDVDLICSNALEYNPDKDPGGEDMFLSLIWRKLNVSVDKCHLWPVHLGLDHFKHTQRAFLPRL